MKNILLSLGLGLVVAGCVSEGPYVPEGRQVGAEFENSIVILDKELVPLVAVDEQEAQRTSQGKLKGFANVRNRTNQDVAIQAQTVFRNASGFSIDDDTAWETYILTAHETRTISAVSSSKKAERYTIRLRLLR